MNIRKFVVGGGLVASILCLLNGCDEALKEDKISVEFAEKEIFIPAGNTASTLLKVKPVAKAKEVTVDIANEGVVSIEGTEITDEGILLSLASHSISSTTIYAIHPDLEDVPECTVTVTPIALTGISLNETEIALNVREQKTLSPILTPDNVTSPTLLWKSEDASIAKVEGGVVTGVKEGETVVTVSSGEFSASCKVVVNAIPVSSLKLLYENKEVAEGETISFLVGEQIKINAEILPEDATYRKVGKWILRDSDPVDTTSFYISGSETGIYVTGKRQGSTSVTARIDVPGQENPLIKTVELKILPKAVPTSDPKIGDYFYSDGTWSDGGLISINPDGTNPVWAATKPAPVEGKTVIGIVFQTNSERIYSSLKESGYTHGLVIGVGALYNPAKKSDPDYPHTAPYSLDEEFGCIGGQRYTGYRWYNDLSGKYWTERVCKYYPGAEIAKCPAFDYATTDYPLPAPTTTSGWYVPSSGELWDYLANLGGGELATYLKSLRDYGSEFDADGYEGTQETFDITSLDEVKLSYNLLDKLNEAWALVPENVRDDLFYCYLNTRCQLSSSTVYEKGEACCIFEMTSDNGFSFQRGWIYGDSMIFHPVLAF